MEIWDDEIWPMAYLITIRTFGTWLHGDERGSVDLHGKNIYGTKRQSPNMKLESAMRDNQAAVPAFLFNGKQRYVVAAAIRRVCVKRSYGLIAINIRTNHAHVVVSAQMKPDIIMTAFKANATRELRNAGLVDRETRIWSRGGSRRYLWKSNQVQGAVSYVIDGQGDDLPDF